jgi:glycosyltransferase involved in cell wall biosynthesis
MVVTNSLTGGGAEKSMNSICNELHSHGWEVLLVPVNSSGPDYVIPNTEIQELNRNPSGGILGIIITISRFNYLVLRWKPTLVIINCDLPELLAASLLIRMKLVAVEHSSIPWSKRKILGKVIRKILDLRGTTWVAVSSHLTIWPKSNTPSLIIQNPVYVQSSQYKNYQRSPVKRIVFIGRLSPEKRPELILDLAYRTNIPINIIGDGELKFMLESKARELDIHATFSGQVIDPWKLIEIGDLLVIPSETEGDGLVAVEAILLRVPFILSAIPEFFRFKLPKKQYFTNVLEAVETIDAYGQNISDLIAPQEIRIPLESARSLVKVGDSWDNFLNSL